MDEVFYEIFSNIPRQAPGDIAFSIKALNAMKNLPANLNILDIGCGSGLHTLEVAKQIHGTITAIDFHQPYLDELSHKAKIEGISNKINCQQGDMFNLQVPENHYDIIWSEGSIYIIGFERGLLEWKKFLKPNGYMVISDANWFKENPPTEVLDFWMREYPSIMTIDEAIKIINKTGYEVISSYRIPEYCWTENYYVPIQANVSKIRQKYQGQPSALDIVETVQAEIDLYKKYSEYYGYMFYIIKKKD